MIRSYIHTHIPTKKTYMKDKTRQKKMIDYSNLFQQLDTGDILVHYTIYGLNFSVFKRMHISKFTGLTMVLRDPVIQNEQWKGLYAIVVTSKVIVVPLVDYMEKLKSRHMRVYVRKLNGSIHHIKQQCQHMIQYRLSRYLDTQSNKESYTSTSFLSTGYRFITLLCIFSGILHSSCRWDVASSEMKRKNAYPHFSHYNYPQHLFYDPDVLLYDSKSKDE